MRTKETLNKGTKAQEKKKNKNQTLIKTGLKKKKKKQQQQQQQQQQQHNTTRSDAHVQLTHKHFYPSLIKSPTKFSPHSRGENFLVGPTIIFPSPLSTKNPPKSFPSSFSHLFFFILPKIHSTKHTIKFKVKCLLGQNS